MLNKHPNFFLPLFKQFDTNKSIKKGLLFNCVLISNFSEIGSNIREFFLNVRKKLLMFYLFTSNPIRHQQTQVITYRS